MIEFQPMTMIFVSYDYLLLQITTSFDFQCKQNLNIKSPIQQQEILLVELIKIHKNIYFFNETIKILLLHT